MGATGAGIGAMFGPVGAGIGGGAGVLAGGLMGLLGSGPDEEEIYNQLMQEYLRSPERAREQQALDDLQKQTVDGPTAQEHTALNQALKVANDQFGSSYGAILANLRARTAGGGGGAAEAALAASEGAGRANNMFQMAEGAAAQEDARQRQAREAYARLALQVQQIGDQYRQWASGRAHGDRMINEAAGMGALSQAAHAIGAGVAAYKNGKAPDASGGGGDGTPSWGELDKGIKGLGSTFAGMGGTPASGVPDLGLSGWLKPESGAAPAAMPSSDPENPASTAAEWAQQFNRKVIKPPTMAKPTFSLWNEGSQ